MARHGQVSVEFFLVVSFLFALAVVLLSQAESLLRDSDSVNSAAMSKVAVDSMAALTELAYLSGNGTVLHSTVFVPAASVCFLLNSSTMTLQCDADPSLSGRVNSRSLRSLNIVFNASCPPQSSNTGWFYLTVQNNGSAVNVGCNQVT